MGEKVLMKGNEAIAEAAIRAGCKMFFGYPITPQTELAAYMAKRLPKIEGGVFLQAESEVAAINMVYGAASAGKRVLTSSSSPGISLKSEGISYIAGSDLPCVIINIVRGGPGLGGIQPAQSDYFQVTKGGGHGDYKMIVLAPGSIQEIVDITKDAFELGEKYRMPVMIMGDGMLGQMMEPIEFPEEGETVVPERPYATNGTKMKREHNIINSLYIDPAELEKTVIERYKRYEQVAKNETRVEEYMTDDAEYIIAAYGTIARVAKSAIAALRAEGIKVGLIRPITLWPFPEAAFKKAAAKVSGILDVEMSMGQMVEDVRLSVNGACPVEFFGRTGGVIPTPGEICDALKKMKEGK